VHYDIDSDKAAWENTLRSNKQYDGRSPMPLSTVNIDPPHDGPPRLPANTPASALPDPADIIDPRGQLLQESINGKLAATCAYDENGSTISITRTDQRSCATSGTCATGSPASVLAFYLDDGR
jgi:hypothetical protein